MLSLFLYLTLYLQNYLGYSPLAAGVRYLPLALAPLFLAPLAGALIGRVQARLLIAIGLALVRRRPDLDGGRRRDRRPCSAAW